MRLVLETTLEGAFILDGIASPDRADHPGEPTVLVLARPGTYFFDSVIEALLANWAEASQVVRIRVKRGHRGPIAVVDSDDGKTSISLDLLAAA